ncbi:MAG: hypothetical protein ACFB12_18875 [Leptolyngbyaceae cyanobacterium]
MMAIIQTEIAAAGVPLLFDTADPSMPTLRRSGSRTKVQNCSQEDI